jgi:3',5'-cyclic AMP phosphodiesterase CpdA
VVNTPSGKKDLFIVYDSADGTVGSKQLQWLQETLQLADKQDFRHIIACTHTHFFKRDGSQGHTSNYTIEETYTLLNLFTQHGVEMLWSGHDHMREITRVKGMTSIVVDSMKDEDKDGIYELDLPSGYPNVIFCRMNPSSTNLNWGTKWDQTKDLVIPTDGKNLFTVANGAWNNASGTWSTK